MLTHAQRLLRVGLFVLLGQSALALAQEDEQDPCLDAEEGLNTRVRVLNFNASLPAEMTDDYEQFLVLLENELNEIAADLVDDEDLEYLDGLTLVQVDRPSNLSRPKRRAYFEEHECVLQTVYTVPKDAERDDGSSATRFLFRSVPGPCFGRKPCLFDSDTYVPPEFNERVLINFATAITLYALSVDAHEQCKPGRAEKLRGKALQKLDAIDFLDPNFRVKVEEIRDDLERPPEPPGNCGG